MTWKVANLYNGLVTSATDHQLTLDPSGFNDTTVPGNTKVIITNITAMCVDGTAGRHLTLWAVPDGGSIGDASQIVYQFPTIQKRPTIVFSAEDIINGWVLDVAESLHAKASTASKIQLKITGVIDNFSGGIIDV